MPRDREELELNERARLAPYAQLSAASRGRRYEESSSDWRTLYQRDRDRVIHSRAFRRLEGKTQVFLSGSGDHVRTRMTHTIEVAAIAGNIARALRLNEDLAEVIGYAHDLGHAPFGHLGEAALNRMMASHGGFEHNRQSLRIVDELELKYPNHPGLNLSWETREGLFKHKSGGDSDRLREEFGALNPSLEAQIADLSDEIAYYSHDLDDGLDVGLLDEDLLYQEVEIWRLTSDSVRERWGTLPDARRRYYTIRCLIDELASDVVEESERRISQSGISSADDARVHAHGKLIAYSERRAKNNRSLRAFLFEGLYRNPVVQAMNDRAGVILERLFVRYLKDPDYLGPEWRDRIEAVGPERSICDYLSGLTDRAAIYEYRELFGPDNHTLPIEMEKTSPLRSSG